MNVGPIYIEPWNRKNTFWRIVALAIVGAWVAWGVTIYQEGQEIQARIQASRAEQERRAEIQRHQVIYQRSLEEQRASRDGVKNSMDMIPVEEGGEEL